MATIAPEVVSELHAALKEAEKLGDMGKESPAIAVLASLRFQNLTARALVTLMAYLSEPAPAICRGKLEGLRSVLALCADAHQARNYTEAGVGYQGVLATAAVMILDTMVGA